MKFPILAAGALSILATAASSEIYQCNFDSKKTRGWAPAVMYFDSTSDTIKFGRDDVQLSSSGSSYFWRVTLRSNNGFRRVKYSLRVGSGIGVGTPVPSRLTIEVKGTQQERTTGTCEVYTG